jgi:hypothetical protein
MRFGSVSSATMTVYAPRADRFPRIAFQPSIVSSALHGVFSLRTRRTQTPERSRGKVSLTSARWRKVRPRPPAWHRHLRPYNAAHVTQLFEATRALAWARSISTPPLNALGNWIVSRTVQW